MQTDERPTDPLPKNFFSIDNLGNRLQSIWEAEKKTLAPASGDLKTESTRLKDILDLHWVFRLGVDVYAKPIEQLKSKDTLWAMGRLLFVCLRLSADEGEVGEAAKRLSKAYYSMLTRLRKHHDQLRPSTSEEKDNLVTDLDSYEIKSDDDDLENPQPVSSHYRPLGSNNRYQFLPDYFWWQGFGVGTSHHHDPLMCIISPDYAMGEVWGYTVDFGVNIAIHGVDDLIQLGYQAAPVVEHLVNVGTQDVGTLVNQGVGELKGAGQSLVHTGIQDFQAAGSFVDHQVVNCCTHIGECFSGVFNSIFHCAGGVCNMLGGCCDGVGNFLNGCAGIVCNFNCNCNCDCGGGGEGCCKICVTGIAGCGYLCSRICCPDSCSDSTSTTSGGDNGGLHHGLGGHESLMKVSATHLSVPASTFFAPTVGTYLMGAYSLVVGTPVVYNLVHNIIKLIKGGDHQQTAYRDRVASAKDLMGSAIVGAALFFGGWFVPYGGPHTAVMVGTFGTYLGNVLSKRRRKYEERETFGGHPYKPQKYVPTAEVLEQLYHDAEYEEQPGLQLKDRVLVYEEIMYNALRKSGHEDQKSLPGRSRAEFLAAQEKLDVIAELIKICGNTAFQEKNQELSTHNPFTHGLRGLAKFYGSLFGNHHVTTKGRADALTAISALQQGQIKEAQTFATTSFAFP